MHGSDGLIFVQNGVEAEIGELLWEVVWWNGDHTVIWRKFLWLLSWKSKWSRDEVWSIGAQMFIEDDFVHGFGKFEIDFTEKSSGI